MNKYIIFFFFTIAVLYTGCDLNNQEETKTNVQTNNTPSKESNTKPFPEKKTINEYTSFSSYEEAVTFYLTNFEKTDSFPSSTAIAKLTKFPNSKRNVFFIYFTSNPSKPYIFEGIDSSTWDSFLNAESKGKFYHAYIKGRYNFNLTQYN